MVFLVLDGGRDKERTLYALRKAALCRKVTPSFFQVVIEGAYKVSELML
jgi:hypothetical protein